MQMKAGFEQSIYAILLLNLLPEKAVLPGEAISHQLGTSPTYSKKMLRKLVCADLITSTTGSKGGFKLKQNPENIRIYDVYLAIEGQQSLYSSSGILDDMLELDKEDRCCLLVDLMDDAEVAWKNVLKQKTIASLSEDMHADHLREELKTLEQWIEEKMVV
ncbi:Rrf2 family transcriptional regulator [Sporosarcina gallistercoris]|uniref:RrF2 family transcriptional regulator n=1 Tax=Sporosarcina gallistercoris TaxID=2762245 RepID=UPI003D2BAD85